MGLWPNVNECISKLKLKINKWLSILELIRIKYECKSFSSVLFDMQFYIQRHSTFELLWLTLHLIQTPQIFSVCADCHSKKFKSKPVPFIPLNDIYCMNIKSDNTSKEPLNMVPFFSSSYNNIFFYYRFNSFILAYTIFSGEIFDSWILIISQ